MNQPLLPAFDPVVARRKYDGRWNLYNPIVDYVESKQALVDKIREEGEQALRYNEPAYFDGSNSFYIINQGQNPSSIPLPLCNIYTHEGVSGCYGIIGEIPSDIDKTVPLPHTLFLRKCRCGKMLAEVVLAYGIKYIRENKDDDSDLYDRIDEHIGFENSIYQPPIQMVYKNEHSIVDPDKSPSFILFCSAKCENTYLDAVSANLISYGIGAVCHFIIVGLLLYAFILNSNWVWAYILSSENSPLDYLSRILSSIVTLVIVYVALTRILGIISGIDVIYPNRLTKFFLVLFRKKFCEEESILKRCRSFSRTNLSQSASYYRFCTGIKLLDDQISRITLSN